MEDLKKAVEDIAKQTKESVDEKFKTATESFVSKSELDELKKKNEQLEDVLKKQGEEMTKKSLELEKSFAPFQGVVDILKSEVEKRENDWGALKTKKGSFEFYTKDAATNTRASVPTASSKFVPAQELRPGVVAYKTNDPIMLQIANVMRTSKPTINWVDETAGEGDAAWTAEGTAKPLMDVNVTVRATTVEKVAVFSKATEEALADIEFLGSLIEGRQRNKLALKIDSGLISGDGTSNTPTGLEYYAPAFTNTEMNDSVVNPNYFDALGAAATQILRANFQATAVLINPVDWFKMMHTKDAEENYVLLQMQMANNSFLEMTAIKSNQVPVGEFYMGDFRYFNVAIREDVRHELGWEGTDFKDNTISMRTEARLAAWVSENEKLAFVWDTYADVMDAIEVAIIE